MKQANICINSERIIKIVRKSYNIEIVTFVWLSHYKLI